MSQDNPCTRPTVEELAESAWWHLVSRHDLAQALDHHLGPSQPAHRDDLALHQLRPTGRTLPGPGPGPGPASKDDQ